MARINKSDVLLMITDAMKLAAAAVPGLSFVGVGIDLLSRAGESISDSKEKTAVSTNINTAVQGILEKYQKDEAEKIAAAFFKTADGKNNKKKAFSIKKKTTKGCLYTDFIEYVKKSVKNDIDGFINDLPEYGLTSDMQTTIKEIFDGLANVVNEAVAGTLSQADKAAVMTTTGVAEQSTDKILDKGNEILKKSDSIAPAAAVQSVQGQTIIALPQTPAYSPKASDIIKPASAPSDARYDTTGIKYYTFGSYPQGKNGESKEILWRKLGETEPDGTVLLMSEYILDCAQYHDDEEEEEISWETSDIRQWLNGTGQGSYYDGERKRSFFETAFQKPKEKKLIQKAANGDKVFLLSVEEAIKELHFKADGDIRGCTVNINRATHGTEYAKAKKDYGCKLNVFTAEQNRTEFKGLFKDYVGNSWWWLKDARFIGGWTRAANVYDDGEVYDPGISDDDSVSDDGGVRPCVCVRLTNQSKKSKK
ncbi:MAG: DUF6273 domain-containing protein [Clostridiales bacterium]|jgi:hypothetical protein|nr:DUF6273 domain-containing protein [Clostridiales bacterium]